MRKSILLTIAMVLCLTFQVSANYEEEKEYPVKVEFLQDVQLIFCAECAPGETLVCPPNGGGSCICQCLGRGCEDYLSDEVSETINNLSSTTNEYLIENVSVFVLLTPDEMQHVLDTDYTVLELVTETLADHLCMGYIDGKLRVVQYSDGDTHGTVTTFHDGVPNVIEVPINVAEVYCSAHVGFTSN